MIDLNKAIRCDDDCDECGLCDGMFLPSVGRGNA